MNWSKYQSKLTEQMQNRYLDYLIDPSFQGVNRLFVLSYENKDDNKVQWVFSSESRNRRLQCCVQLEKFLWSTNKKL